MQKKIKYLNIALLFLLPPAMALVVKDYLSYRVAPASRQSRPAQAAAAPKEPAISDYSQIIEAPVFPSKTRKLTAAQEPVPGKGGQGQTPSILSQIKLLGTYVGPNSFAVFERAGAQAVFKIGESVFDAGTLKTVQRDRAVISYGLGEAAITMEDEPQSLPRLKGTEPAAETEDTDFAPVTGGEASGGTGVERIDDKTFALDQKAVTSSLGNMNKILSDARMTPRVSGKGIEGFMVTEIKKGGVFDLIGLRNGDVLTRINGYDIDTPEKAMQVLSGLRGETAISLDIIRGGNRQTLSYQIR